MRGNEFQISRTLMASRRIHVFRTWNLSCFSDEVFKYEFVKNIDTTQLMEGGGGGKKIKRLQNRTYVSK